MLKHILLASAALSFAVWAAPATSADYATLGRLTCTSKGSTGMIIMSQKNLMCIFEPSGGGAPARYAGMIQKYGVDLGITGRSVMVWVVLAKTGTPFSDIALAGEYYGVGADASVAAGGGAKVIAGGTNRAFMLQPLNVQAQEGVNVAIGVEKMTLAPASI
ncbi:DUF992 domain-containing protein [Rhizobium sp. LEGMi198b]|uniref:DUF992 domain-containing protein n=1 Tax=unclassified Rhizobium TaxID=2613769 RepID=UPI000CDF567F|nr:MULTISPECIES: DUF992 domain-containing protein [Rhizobium]AVA22928.1 hypothetical protein NXC24_CH03304 [Rhizobium sp. NXC24]MDK4738075.1 DUF992 domain-containing protein [Rhizobium sp. CNPSo 3464]UWU20300.1 DUF992 domain-containing protein [Rhizobium tropici]WFU01118.1 DUF992 domain-containing protein [Rhizobium sp. CB3171]